MRRSSGLKCCVAMAALWAMAGCSMHKPAPVRPKETPTPMPTVAPASATPTEAATEPVQETVTPLPTRPIEDVKAGEVARQAGKEIGPVITYIGAARADGVVMEPKGKKNGLPVFENYAGSGFILVVEAKPGLGNAEVGRRIFAYREEDPAARPDLEVQFNRDLGDGSRAVCDRRRPNIGGVPAVNPPSFADTPEVAAAVNDFGCRFEIFTESESACLVAKHGDFSFVNPETTTQFCAQIARAWNFPVGDTLVSARLRDVNGNPGPVAKFWLRRPERMPKSNLPEKTPVPTPPRRRP